MMPRTRAPKLGKPVAIASSSTLGMPSDRDGRTKASAAFKYLSGWPWFPINRTWLATSSSSASCSQAVRVIPSPMNTSPHPSGKAGRARANPRRSMSPPFSGLCRPTNRMIRRNVSPSSSRKRCLVAPSTGRNRRVSTAFGNRIARSVAT